MRGWLSNERFQLLQPAQLDQKHKSIALNKFSHRRAFRALNKLSIICFFLKTFLSGLDNIIHSFEQAKQPI